MYALIGTLFDVIIVIGLIDLHVGVTFRRKGVDKPAERPVTSC